MRIGFVAVDDARDVGSWSGIPFHMSRALADAGAEIVDINPLRVPRPRWEYARFVARQKLGDRSYRTELNPTVLASFGREITERLREADVDAVLTTSTLAVSRVSGPWPVAIWTDATLANLVGFYREFSRLSPRALSSGARSEFAALNRAALAFYSSRWAARSAVEDYGISEERVSVVPFGANLVPSGSETTIVARAAARSSETCTLVFLGVDWKRKRAEFALEVASVLNRIGIPARIRLIGVKPPSGVTAALCRSGWFVSKASARGRDFLMTSLSDVHFLIMLLLADVHRS